MFKNYHTSHILGWRSKLPWGRGKRTKKFWQVQISNLSEDLNFQKLSYFSHFGMGMKIYQGGGVRGAKKFRQVQILDLSKSLHFQRLPYSSHFGMGTTIYQAVLKGSVVIPAASFAALSGYFYSSCRNLIITVFTFVQ